MPDPTPAAVEGILTAGIVVTLGSTTLTNVYSTPDMGAEPERVDVTSFDNMTKKAYIAGLEDVSTLNFDFYVTSNELPANQTGVQCTVTYPAATSGGTGISHSFTADVHYFMLAAGINEPLKARASCVVSDWGESDSNSGD